MTVTSPAFGTQLIGQTEKTLNAILDRLLAGTGLTEPQWVTLTLTAVSGGTLGLDQLTGRVADTLKVDEAAARARIGELAAARLLATGETGQVAATDAGQAQWNEIRAAVTQITQGLWGDLPAEDLATAARVLSTVRARANEVLAG